MPSVSEAGELIAIPFWPSHSYLSALPFTRQTHAYCNIGWAFLAASFSAHTLSEDVSCQFSINYHVGAHPLRECQLPVFHQLSCRLTHLVAAEKEITRRPPTDNASLGHFIVVKSVILISHPSLAIYFLNRPAIMVGALGHTSCIQILTVVVTFTHMCHPTVLYCKFACRQYVTLDWEASTVRSKKKTPKA